VTSSRLRFTSRADGNLSILHPEPSALAAARARLSPWPWTWLSQVHGADVLTVTAPGAGAGTRADAAVTTVPGAVLAVQTADCAPVALLADGVVAAAHAGWRGLEAGVLGATVERMRSLGATDIQAVLGPCIHAECYEFGAADLDRLAARFGDGVRGTTAAGTPALDVPAAVRLALTELDVDLEDADVCTACDESYFSHRARGDSERQSLLVWMEPAG
jgi:hypothetical protein